MRCTQTIVVVALASCSAPVPVTSAPLYFQSDTSVTRLPQDRQDRVRAAGFAMLDAWRSLGGVADPAALQVVTLSYGGVRTDSWAGTTAGGLYLNTTFYDDSFGLTDTFWAQLAWHEFGHVLGAAHLPCSAKGLMAPELWCYVPQELAYTAADIADMCANGFGGPACGAGVVGVPWHKDLTASVN